MRKYGLRDLSGFSIVFGSLFLFIAAFTFARGADLAPGQKIFEGKCTQCHGKDAKGVPKMAKVLKVDPSAVDLTSDAASKLKAEEMELTVTNGKKKMPKFKGKLTEAEIKDVVAYIKSLQGSPAPAADKKKD